jgi:hypothetical protein
MGEVIIHYYPHTSWYLSSLCGIYCDNIKDMSNDIKYVTCKKCLKKYNETRRKKKRSRAEAIS